MHLSQNKLSGSGKWVFLITCLFVFSISASYRLPLFGLLVHPYLVVLPIAVLLSEVRLFNSPSKVLMPLLFFSIIFFVASLQNDNPFSEPFKVLASILTFLFFSASVKTQRDFYVISWGFIMCAAVLGFRGFLISDAAGVSRLSGINVLEGIGNKNAQSLFTLPGLFLGTVVFGNLVSRRKWFLIIILAGCIFLILMSIFLSANRSGLLGLAFIFLSALFISGIHGPSLILSIIVLGFSYVVIENYSKDIFEHKTEQTIEGYSSDRGRMILINESISAGLKNPILGMGMDRLHREMASKLKNSQFGRQEIDTHFLPGYIFGATGIFSLLLFFTFLARLTNRLHNPSFAVCNHARRIVISFVVLFVVRSFFTREILYSPTFIGAMGLVYGYYLMTVRNAKAFRN